MSFRIFFIVEAYQVYAFMFNMCCVDLFGSLSGARILKEGDMIPLATHSNRLWVPLV